MYFLLVLAGCGAVGQSTADDEMNPIFHYIQSDSVFYMAQATTTQQGQVAGIVAGEGEEASAEQADAGNASQENIGSRLAVPATIAAAIIFSILVSGL